MHDLAECADDLWTIADFKRDLRAALDDCFALSKADAASHPFVTATVLDPTTMRCELFLWVTAKCSIWSRTCVDVRGRRIIASRDWRRGRWWECITASPARQDGQPVSVVEVTGDRCCYPVFDDQLITDYHVTMIGYRKNRVSHLCFVVLNLLVCHPNKCVRAQYIPLSKAKMLPVGLICNNLEIV